MIALFRYITPMGSQYSVRAGGASELAYQIFFRDGLKRLLDYAFNAKSKKLKAQFEYAESVYQAQCDNTITLEMIKNYRFNTDIGGFECLATAENTSEIDALVSTILTLTEKKRQNNPSNNEAINKLVDVIRQAKNGETREIVSAINEVHHIL